MTEFEGIPRADGRAMWLVEIVPVTAFFAMMVGDKPWDDSTRALLEFAQSCINAPAGGKPVCLTCDAELAKCPGRFLVIKGNSKTDCLITAQCAPCSHRFSDDEIAKLCIEGWDGTCVPVHPPGHA